MGDSLALLIPIIAIVCIMGVGALRLLVEHREKLARIHMEQVEREAERDRELLGLSNPLGSAHLEAVLARLTSLEARLAAMEQGGQGQAAAPMAKAGTERVVSPDDAEAERTRPGQANLN